MIRIVRTPVILITKPDDGETQLPVIDCTHVLREGDMAEPL